MTPDCPIHGFRPPAQPRTRIRPECRPVASAFGEWLRPDKNAAAAPPAPVSPQEPAPAPAAPPGERSILLTPLRSPGTGGRKQRIQQERPVVDWANLVPSPIEWVFLNKLGRKFPEAWAYMRREALIYAGDDPDEYGISELNHCIEEQPENAKGGGDRPGRDE